VVVTATDGDGDTDTDSNPIGDKLKFDDDGPTASIVDGTGMVQIDESSGTQDDDTTAPGVIALFAGVANKGSDTNLPQYATNATALVDVSGTDFGTDDAAAMNSSVLTLEIVPVDGDSGLTTTDGEAIKLFVENGLIVGRYDDDGAGTLGAVDAGDPAAFAIAINQDGTAAIAQYVSLTHLIAGDDTLGEHDDQIDLDGKVNVVVTATDGDGDTDTDSNPIGDKLKFDDDGPAVTVADLTGTFTTDVQSSTWSDSPGTDGFKSLNITLDSYTIDANSTVNIDDDLGTLLMPDVNGNFVYNGSSLCKNSARVLLARFSLNSKNDRPNKNNILLIYGF
jgi:hypothetical protein